MKTNVLLPATFLIILFTASGSVHAQHSDSTDILNYSINLDITDIAGHNIGGYTDLLITPRIGSLDVMALDLLSLTVDSVFEDGAPCSFTYNDTLLRITLQAVLISADTSTIRVYYHGHPVIDPSGWGGFYFNSSTYAFNLGVGFEDNPHNYGRVWYPCIDDFVDRATYDCFITVQQGMKAICGGTLVSSTVNSDTTETWHWNIRDEIPSYLSSVAVGIYTAVTDTFNGLLGDIPIYIYVRPQDSLKAVTSFSKLKQTLAVFETCFGPYRWERVGYVGVPFSNGAMEHVTNIAYPNVCIDGGYSYETLYAHELSHHWFGDLVTCSTAEDMWLNEGWAVYCEYIFREFIYGEESARIALRSNHLNVIKQAHIYDGGYYALYGVPHEITYGTTVYDRGAMVVHTLRGYLGDSLFFDAITAYLEEYKFMDVSSFQFRDFLTGYTGIDMTGFFDAWVFAPGYPHFSVDSFSVSPSGGNYDVTVYVRQKIFERSEYASSNRLELTFMDAAWNRHTETIEFSGQTTGQTFSIPIQPVIVMMDAEEKTADATVDLYQTVKNTGYAFFSAAACRMGVTGITDSCFLRVEHNYVAPDPFKTPLYGYVLSDRHYWKVDGILDGTLTSTVQLEFINTSATAIDDWLISDSLDPDTALFVMYRANTADDWVPVNAIKSGGDNYGFMIADSFRLGEYCFAVFDPPRYDSLGLDVTRKDAVSGLTEKRLYIYPNPSDNQFSIECAIELTGTITIQDPAGRTVYRRTVEPGNNTVAWDPGEISGGFYYIRLTEPGRPVCTGKVIYIR